MGNGDAARPLRVVVVGLGIHGRWWLQIVRRAPDTTLVGVVDASATARAAARDLAGDVPAWASVAEALEAVRADAAIVVVPTALHEAVAGEALRAGWHVLLEKPLAHDLASAARIVGAALRAGRTLMVSQDYRWTAPVAALRHHARAGLIGELGSIRHTYTMAGQFEGWRAALPDLFIEDMLIHHVDLLRYLTGRECEELYAHSFRPAWSPLESNMAASILLRFTGDLHVAYNGTWVGAGPQTTWTGTIEMEGTEGLLRLCDDALIHYARDDRTGRALSSLAPSRERQDAALAHFVDAIRMGTQPETDGRDNLRSLAIVQAALVSARTGRPVRPPAELAEALASSATRASEWPGEASP